MPLAARPGEAPPRLEARAWWLPAFAFAVACTGIAALVLALVRGWLGPDIGRGGGFCEAAREGLLRQPANTLSNLGFVVAGLCAAWHASTQPGRGPLTRPLAAFLVATIVLLGPGSAAMHASQSDLGGHLDLTSMFLISSFALAYAVSRLTGGGGRVFTRCYLAALLVQEIVEIRGGAMPLLMTTGNGAFAATLIAAVAGEEGLRRRGRGVDLRWGAAALSAIVLAFGIWTLAKDGGPLCDPRSLLQGHAAWHLLCAAAAYALYRAYAGQDDRYADSRVRPSPA